MEQERFSGEEPEKKKTRRKRRGLDVRGFLEEIGFLEQRTDQQQPEAQEDDIESAGKKKRRKRIGEWLREKKEKFFGPLIPEPEFVSDEVPVNPEYGQGREDLLPKTEENPLFAIAHEVSDDAEQNVQQAENNEDEQPSIERVIEGLSENAAEQPTVMAETVYEQPVETYELHDRLEDVTPGDESDSSYTYNTLPITERAGDREPEPEVRRVTDKRAVAVSVLLAGAERHARRTADRDIEKKHEKEIKEVRQELEKERIAREESVRAVRNERRQQIAYERLPEQREPTTERKTYPTPVIPNLYRGESRPEAPKFAPPTPEFIAAQEGQSRLTEVTTQLKTPERPAIRPETVLHQVEAAAEQNIPIEAMYERRQEIKDESTTKAAALKVAAIGGGASSTVIGVGATQPRQKGITNLRNAGRQIANEPMYRQAVVSGMGTALVIIAGIVIIALTS